MKSILIFFVFLCAFFSKEHCDLHVKYYDKDNYAKVSQQSKTADAPFRLIKSNVILEKTDNFISAEDEDDNFSVARKYTLLIKYFIALVYAAFLISFYKSLKSRLPFCSRLSYIATHKYLLQRVLRL